MDTTQKLTAEMLDEIVSVSFLAASMLEADLKIEALQFYGILNGVKTISFSYFIAINIEVKHWSSSELVAIWNYAKQLEAIVKNHKTTN